MIQLKKIGKGGFSGCYQLQHDDEFVYKIFSKKSDKFSDELTQNEIQIFNKIDNQSQYIVKYYGFKQSENHVTIKLEKCHSDLLKFKKHAKLSYSDIMQILLQLTEAIKFLHDLDIIHCDIKAGNILINFNSDAEFTLKLCDFGLSQIQKQYVDCIKGTEMFIDPSLIHNSRICHKTDIWSLGSLILQLVIPHQRLTFLTTENIKKGLDIVQQQIDAVLLDVKQPFLQFVLKKCLVTDYKQRISSKQLHYLLMDTLSHGKLNINFRHFNYNIALPPLIDTVRSSKHHTSFQSPRYKFIKLKHNQSWVYTQFDIKNKTVTAFNLNEDQFTRVMPQLSKIVKEMNIKGEFKYARDLMWIATKLRNVDQFVQFQLKLVDIQGIIMRQHTYSINQNSRWISIHSGENILLSTGNNLICTKIINANWQFPA